MSEVSNHLAALRKARGLRAAELATAVGVSRQTIYAMESGDYMPNTVVALRLARALGSTVEELFTLSDVQTPEPPDVDAHLLFPASPGDAVRLCRVGDELVAVPSQPMPEFFADATALLQSARATRAKLQILDEEAADSRQLLVAGCDPAIAFLTRAAAIAGVDVVAAPAPSKRALAWLKQRVVHVAGSHLEDPRSGEFNVRYVRKVFGDEETVVVTYASWEEGLVLKAGNPKGVREAGDLARAGIRFRNREAGSGARALIDHLLKEAGVPANSVAGYDELASGHLSAAMAVASGQADCCLATASAARAHHLHFIPLKTERYDFVFRRELMDTVAIRTLMDVLQRASLRNKLRSLAGYDTSDTGKIVST